MQGCAFSGSRWWIITFRYPKSPQNSYFGGLNRHFKPNMQKNSNSYIFRSVYHIDMKFDRQLRPATETLWVVSYGGNSIQRWRMATIFKIDISPYLSEKSSDFDEILYTAADFELDEHHVIKNEKVALDRLQVRQNVFLITRITRGQSNLTKRGHPRGSKVVPLNSWGRVSY